MQDTIFFSLVVFVGSYIGKLLAGKINESYYKVIIKFIITILAVRMLVKLIRI